MKVKKTKAHRDEAQILDEVDRVEFVVNSLVDIKAKESEVFKRMRAAKEAFYTMGQMWKRLTDEATTRATTKGAQLKRGMHIGGVSNCTPKSTLA